MPFWHSRQDRVADRAHRARPAIEVSRFLAIPSNQANSPHRILRDRVLRCGILGWRVLNRRILNRRVLGSRQRSGIRHVGSAGIDGRRAIVIVSHAAATAAASTFHAAGRAAHPTWGIARSAAAAIPPAADRAGLTAPAAALGERSGEKNETHQKRAFPHYWSLLASSHRNGYLAWPARPGGQRKPGFAVYGSGGMVQSFGTACGRASLRLDSWARLSKIHPA